MAAAQGYEILFMGVASSEKASRVFSQYHELARLVAEPLNQNGMRGDVKLRIFTTPEELCDALRSGQIHFAPLHPAVYLEQAATLADVHLFAAETFDGSLTAHGVLVTPTSVSIRTLTQVKGRALGLGPEGDPLLDFAARAALFQNGIRKSDLNLIKHLEHSDELEELCLVGRYQVAALPASIVKPGDKTYRILAEIQAPGRVWVLNDTLYPVLKQAIQNTLLQLNDPSILKNLGIEGLAPARHEDLLFFIPTLKKAQAFSL